MPNVFTPRADTVLHALLLTAGLVVVGALASLVVLGQPGVRAAMGTSPPQPVMFSHEHHVSRLGLDCRYCHQHAERSVFAGLPSAQTCMNCHAELYTTAPMLEPVRRAWLAGEPVAWRRVYDLPDFTHFSHKVHVLNAIACVRCHGRMDEQPMTRLSTPMTMGWCLDCHRHPEPQLVDPSAVFLPDALSHSLPPGDPVVDRPLILTNCSACHY